MSTDLRIDFLNRHRWPRAGVALAVLACAAAAWQSAQALRESAALRQLRSQAAVQTAQPGGERRPALTAAAQSRLQQIDRLVGYLATPWGPLLALFEAHASPQLRLLRFEPNAAEGRVELRGRARSVQALGVYLRALENDPRLHDVQLRRHERVQDDDSGDIEFTLAAGWAAPGLADPPAAAAAASASASTSTSTSTSASAPGVQR